MCESFIGPGYDPIKCWDRIPSELRRGDGVCCCDQAEMTCVLCSHLVASCVDSLSCSVACACAETALDLHTCAHVNGVAVTRSRVVNVLSVEAGNPLPLALFTRCRGC